MALSPTIILALVGAFILAIRILRIGRRPANYPPGPPTVPVLGNLHQMPSHNVHLQFQKWAQEYGPIYSLIFGTQTLVVLSSDTAIKDLLDKRSAIYSSRLDAYLAQTLGSGGKRVSLMPYGPQWRSIHKVYHTLLNIRSARSYVPYQMLENRQMLHDILTQPTAFFDHIRRYTNSVTSQMLFGWRTSAFDDPELKLFFDTFEELGVIVHQNGLAALVDYFPVIRWLPDFLLPIRARAIARQKTEQELYLRHWLRIKKRIQNGTAMPCFSVDFARMQEKEGFSDELASYIAGVLFEAGSDTTSNTIYGFIQAMVLFPEAQRKAQEELDRIVGTDRLPTMEDEPNLQYIRCCVKESLRWMPTAILGALPHCVTEDDRYMGYDIPKGAGVLNNVYTIHMDPHRYPNPRKFDPDRYKDDFKSAFDSVNNADVSKRDHFIFGAGRRVCQGMHIAERSLFLAISRILWAFKIEPAKDENGNDVLPDPDEYTQGILAMPVPYQAKITPRSADRAARVEKEWTDAQTLLDENKQWTTVPDGMRGSST